MSTRTSYTPPGTEWMDDFNTSPAIRVGDLVWLSGVVVSPQEGQSLEDAIDKAFSTIQMILEDAGLTWNEVIDVTTFHVGLEPQKEVFLKVKDRYITEKPYPCWTAIEVAGLWRATLVAEIKVVASAA